MWGLRVGMVPRQGGWVRWGCLRVSGVGPGTCWVSGMGGNGVILGRGSGVILVVVRGWRRDVGSGVW